MQGNLYISVDKTLARCSPFLPSRLVSSHLRLPSLGSQVSLRPSETLYNGHAAIDALEFNFLLVLFVVFAQLLAEARVDLELA